MGGALLSVRNSVILGGERWDFIKRSRLKGRCEEKRNRGERRKGSDALTYSISKQI